MRLDFRRTPNAGMVALAGGVLVLGLGLHVLGMDLLSQARLQHGPVQLLQLDFEAPPATAAADAPDGCGDTCRHDIQGTPSLFFDFIRKRVDCKALWENATIDAPMAEPTPPDALPAHLLDAFTYGGRVPVRPWVELLNQRYLGGNADTHEWSAALVDDWAGRCQRGTLGGNYGEEETRELAEGMRQAAPLGRVLVIGSENPWVEACALGAGAAHVTTLEYGRITSHHPKVAALTPDEARGRFATMSEAFDTIVTFSSVEHAGLGRYGDALNPWGDRQTIARAWCAAKPGAHLVIGVPTEGTDSIMYNAHRIYGPIMYPHLVANWEQVWRAPRGSQVVHVLRKPA